MPTRVENAAYAIVHATRDSARDISERTGIGHAVLLNKVNPNAERNMLTLSESVEIQRASGDHRILFAVAEELGYVCMPAAEIAGSQSVVGALAKTCAEFGDYMRKVEDSMADEVVTHNELYRLEKELSEWIAASMKLQAILAARCVDRSSRKAAA